MAQLLSIFKKYPVAVICLFVVLVCGILIYLRGGVIEELTEEENTLAARLRLLDGNAKKGKGLQKDLENVELLVEQIDARLFELDQKAVNINFFYGLEDKMPIRIASIAQMKGAGELYAKGGPRALGLYAPISYSMTVSGTFSEILEFVHALHHVDPLIRVGDYQLEVDGKKRGGGQLQARLQIIVLARK